MCKSLKSLTKEAGRACSFVLSVLSKNTLIIQEVSITMLRSEFGQPVALRSFSRPLPFLRHALLLLFIVLI